MVTLGSSWPAALLEDESKCNMKYAIPQRIFLDTSTINFIVDNSEIIFDGDCIPDKANERVKNDIIALQQIFFFNNVNPVEMVISKTTFDEINATNDKEKKELLLSYCSELWRYFHVLVEGDFTAPNLAIQYFEEYLITKGLDNLVDANDRRLIIESLFYKCDVFCTRDYKTILKYRNVLKKIIPLEIITPFELYLRYRCKKIY